MLPPRLSAADSSLLIDQESLERGLQKAPAADTAQCLDRRARVGALAARAQHGAPVRRAELRHGVGLPATKYR